MNEVIDLLQRQAEWQKSRASLSWSEKLVLAETLRDAALVMRAKPKESGAPDGNQNTIGGADFTRQNT